MFLKRILNLIIAASLLLVMLSSCAGASTVKISEMTLEELEECVSLCQYKDLELTLGEKTKEEALLSHIDANSSIKKYPAGTVDYYFEQLKANSAVSDDELDTVAGGSEGGCGTDEEEEEETENQQPAHGERYQCPHCGAKYINRRAQCTKCHIPVITWKEIR